MLIEVIDCIRRINRYHTYSFLEICPKNHQVILIPKRDIIEVPKIKQLANNEIPKLAEAYLNISSEQCLPTRISLDILLESYHLKKRISSIGFKKIIRTKSNRSPRCGINLLTTNKFKYEINIEDEEFDTIYTQIKTGIITRSEEMFSCTKTDICFDNPDHVKFFKYLVREYIALKKYGWIAL